MIFAREQEMERDDDVERERGRRRGFVCSEFEMNVAVGRRNGYFSRSALKATGTTQREMHSKGNHPMREQIYRPFFTGKVMGECSRRIQRPHIESPCDNAGPPA